MSDSRHEITIGFKGETYCYIHTFKEKNGYIVIDLVSVCPSVGFAGNANSEDYKSYP